MSECKGEIMVNEPQQADPMEVQRQADPMEVQRQQHMDLMKLAVESGGVEKLEKLMALQERWEQNNARKNFFDAMTKFQKSLPVIRKKGLAKFDHKDGCGKTSYSYAKLEDIAAAIKDPLAENYLSYRFEQATEPTQNGLFIDVICIVTHKDGHSESARMSGYPDGSGKKNPIQQLASTSSYLRRYTLTGVLGITVSDEDDDAASKDDDAASKDDDAASKDDRNFPNQKREAKVNAYPQDQFDRNFPNWQKQILDGRKTAKQLIDFLFKKDVKLSHNQIDKINGAQAEYQR